MRGSTENEVLIAATAGLFILACLAVGLTSDATDYNFSASATATASAFESAIGLFNADIIEHGTRVPIDKFTTSQDFLAGLGEALYNKCATDKDYTPFWLSFSSEDWLNLDPTDGYYVPKVWDKFMEMVGGPGTPAGKNLLFLNWAINKLTANFGSYGAPQAREERRNEWLNGNSDPLHLEYKQTELERAIGYYYTELQNSIPVKQRPEFEAKADEAITNWVDNFMESQGAELSGVSRADILSHALDSNPFRPLSPEPTPQPTVVPALTTTTTP